MPARTAADDEEPFLADAGRAFLLSAVLPGAGQGWLGLGRWVPFAAVEAWGWATYIHRRGRSGRLEQDYRDIAWSVARRVSVPREPRVEGAWDYYEAVGKWHASGVFDADPRTPVVQPERDEATYNGMIWGLARAIHFPPGGAASEDSPEYEQAIQYYMRRAVRPELAWSWGDNGLERQVYLELVRERDEATRAATRALGLIVANHLIGAVDALIASRLQGRGVAPSGLRIEGMVAPHAADGRWMAGLRLFR
jgi:hypothetical protein